MHKLFFIAGALFIITGFFILYGERLGIGKLPGDITIKGENFQFHFPVVTCIIASLVLSGVIWVLRLFRS